MELEELKAGWEKVSEKIDRQLQVNTKLIHKMTQQQYRSQLSKISYPELLGAFICLIMAGALVWNFNRLDTVALQIFGGVSALFLVGLPAISLRSLQGFGQIDAGAVSYAETLRAFAVRRRRFTRLQRLNMVLATPFVIALTPTMVRMLADKDITGRLSFWLVVIPISVALQFLVSRWAFQYYDRSMKQAEALLAELR